MPRCPDADSFDRVAQVGADAPNLAHRIWRRYDADENGAVLIFSLVGVLILMLMAWTVMDAGTAARNKIEIQASADAAAYSHASVKARSMNMLAYANIAKRSIVGIHSLYPSMYTAFRTWIDGRWARCTAGDDAACEEAARNEQLFWLETLNDYTRFTQNAKDYYAADIRALDNYQFYLFGLTPWWAWTEGVVRAQRNNALLSSTFPPPAGLLRGALPDMTNRIAHTAGPNTAHNFTSFIDTLPVKRGDYWVDLLEYGMKQPAYLTEHAANTLHHKNRSIWGAADNWTIHMGSTVMFPIGFEVSTRAFGRYGRPWRLEPFQSEARWLTRTSAMAFSYRLGEGYFEEKRQKFSVPGHEHEWTSDDQAQTYKPKGYWAMSRSEMTFQSDGSPDLWHAVWTARLRPVSLPDEFWEAGYDVNAAFHDVVPFLSLSAMVGSAGARRGEEQFDDLVYFERATRGMGQSTIEGVAK